MTNNKLTGESLDQLISCEQLASDNAQFAGNNLDFAYHRDIALALVELQEYRNASREPVAEVVAWSHSEKTGRNCDVRLLQFNLKPGLLYAGPALPALTIPPVSKGVDHYSQGWNACRTAMIQRLTEDVVTKKQ